MDVLKNDLAKLQKDANLDQSMRDVDKIIAQLERARGQIVQGKEPEHATIQYILTPLPDPSTAAITLTKLQNPLKSNFDKLTDDLKRIHKGHSTFGKSLDKVWITSRLEIYG